MTQSASANWRDVSQASRATSTGKTRSSNALTRSKSQPKKCTDKIKPPAKSTPSPIELGMAQARTYADSATSEQLEMRLQQLLLNTLFTDAALLIAASTHLNSRFQTADVVRLMLEKAKSSRSLEEAAQLVRDLQLQKNEALVTLLINETVRAMQFGAAVRLAQEMVPDFEQLSATAERPCWTPPALIQAMVRARKFRAALKYSKQFGLLDTFPAPQLVAGMLETRSWEEAISSIMEMHLFTEFPLEALAVEMIKQRQWSQAIKCINKLSDKDDTRTKFYEALVRETAHVGNFVTSVSYLREFKLDQGNGDATLSLLKYLVDAMIAQNEFYKAIKYAIKFNLAKNPFDDAVAALNGQETSLKEDKNTDYLPQYNVEHLIRKAMEGGQYHVALTYIKKLHLRERFADELVALEKVQQIRLQEFRHYAHLRLAQFQEASHQANLRTLLSDQEEDEMIDLEPVQMDIVISEEQEIISRKEKAQQVTSEHSSQEKESESMANAFTLESSRPVERRQQSKYPTESAGQSRFGFARSPSSQSQFPIVSVPAVKDVNTDTQFYSQSGPSNTAPLPPGLLNTLDKEPTLVNAHDCASDFTFANFAQSVSLNSATPPPSSLYPSPQPPQPPQQQPFLTQHQQQGQTSFTRPMPPIPNSQFAGYSMSPMMPQQTPTYFPQGNMPLEGMQFRGYPQPPPPPTGGEAFDVASLAMQFHNTSTSSSLSSFGNFVDPRPSMSFPQPPTNDSQVIPGMPFQMPPPPPQSSFKPSMSYTSVTTTRQKK